MVLGYAGTQTPWTPCAFLFAQYSASSDSSLDFYANNAANGPGTYSIDACYNPATFTPSEIPMEFYFPSTTITSGQVIGTVTVTQGLQGSTVYSSNVELTSFSGSINCGAGDYAGSFCPNDCSFTQVAFCESEFYTSSFTDTYAAEQSNPLYAYFTLFNDPPAQYTFIVNTAPCPTTTTTTTSKKPKTSYIQPL